LSRQGKNRTVVALPGLLDNKRNKPLCFAAVQDLAQEIMEFKVTDGGINGPEIIAIENTYRLRLLKSGQQFIVMRCQVRKRYIAIVLCSTIEHEFFQRGTGIPFVVQRQ